MRNLFKAIVIALMLMGIGMIIAFGLAFLNEISPTLMMIVVLVVCFILAVMLIYRELEKENGNNKKTND